MPIARGRRDSSLTEMLADHGNPFAERKRAGSVGMTAVMDPNVIETRPFPNTLPDHVQVLVRIRGQVAQSHVQVLPQ